MAALPTMCGRRTPSRRKVGSGGLVPRTIGNIPPTEIESATTPCWTTPASPQSLSRLASANPGAFTDVQERLVAKLRVSAPKLHPELPCHIRS